MTAQNADQRAAPLADTHPQPEAGDAKRSSGARTAEGSVSSSIELLVSQGDIRGAFGKLEKHLETSILDEVKSRQYFSRDGLLGKASRKRSDALVSILTFSIFVGTAEVAGRVGIAAAFSLLVGVLVVMLTAETVTRAWAWRRFGISGEGVLAPALSVPDGVTTATSDWIYEFNAEYGFDFRRNASVFKVHIRDGIVTRSTRIDTDSQGNVTPTDSAFDDNALNILVVGDSFTCDPGNSALSADATHLEWPNLLKLNLEKALGAGSTRIMNCARPSFGVLQMIDLAAAKLRELKPDIIILAFISRDLERARRYISRLTIAGRMRELMHADRTDTPHLSGAADVSIIDARITEELIASHLSAGSPSPALNDIRLHILRLVRRASGRTFSIFAANRSCLVDLALCGTIFTRMERPPQGTFPSLDYTDFGQDAKFVESLAAIRATATRLLLVHLPEARELVIGEVLARKGTGFALLQSLNSRSGEPLHFLGGKIKASPDEIAARFRRAHGDAHPSLWAKQLYADAITPLVLANRGAKPTCVRGH